MFLMTQSIFKKTWTMVCPELFTFESFEKIVVPIISLMDAGH